jgi:DNA/RNA-binding domain of Phe-tRNA-synthetase-like protein
VSGEEPPIRAAAVDAALAAELPGLGLRWCAFALAGDPLRRSPAELRARLRALADRHRGAQAIALRSRAIPHAYRVLFRHLGLEPDVRRIPVEAAVVERLVHGGFPSRGLLEDALLIATVDTETGVWALDADRVSGEPRLVLDGGRVVVADATGPLADVFAPPAGPLAVTRATRRALVYAVLATGVPEIAAEEALWTVWELTSTA